ISSQLTLASDLVTSHAAICYAISEDRENLLVGYPSEPLLAEAEFFLIEDKGNLSDTLRKGGLVSSSFLKNLFSCSTQTINKHSMKNYQSPYASADKKYSSLAKMHPEQVFTGENLENYSGEYLSIYWQLRYTGKWFIDPPNILEKFEDQGWKVPATCSYTKSESQMKRLNKKIICMSSFGMDCFKFLDNEVMGILKQIVVSYVTPFDPE
ncbi:17106_t:CDS:2, partial [Funneliformis caledonium]